MFEDRARVLLILPQEVLDRARVRGRIDDEAEGPVSLQMALRALIDEGLKESAPSPSQCRGLDAGGEVWSWGRRHGGAPGRAPGSGRRG
jgi:hypothetical protein